MTLCNLVDILIDTRDQKRRKEEETATQPSPTAPANKSQVVSRLSEWKAASDVVLETRVLVLRRLKVKNESLGLEHLVLALVLKKKSCSFSRFLL